MDSHLHDLNRRIIAHIHRGIRRQRHLRQTERPWVWILGGSNDLEDGYHWEGHVGWSLVGTAGAESEVYVEECCCVALEPSGLDSDGAACCWP